MLRETLGALTELAVRRLNRFARRIGSPALASVPVSAAMLSRLDTVNVEQPLDDVAQLLVAGRHPRLLVVGAHGSPVGVVTRADIAVAVQVLGPHAPVAEAPLHDVVTVAPSDSLSDVIALLRGAPEAVAVVIDRGSPVGLLTLDGLSAYADESRPAA